MQPSELIKRLAEIQFRFDKKSKQEKHALLTDLKNAEFKRADDIIRLHDRLLCMKAFADNQEIYDTADELLLLIAEKTQLFLEEASFNETWKLTLSAIAGTTIRASFSLETVKWLRQNFKDAVSFYSCDADKETVGYVFKQILPPAVGESLFDNKEQTLERLVKMTSSSSNKVDVLRWILTQFENAPINDKSKEQLYEQLKIFIEWKTNSSSPTRTFARVSGGRDYFLQEGGIIHHADVRNIFKNKNLKPITLSETRKKHLCAVAKGVLCSNYREIDPITYAQVNDTELYDMGRGITIALYFMRPSLRLPCETYASYMAFRNGVPVSYGGGWMFFKGTKLAGNIFPPFRGGESAYLFAQLYRLYHLRFSVNCFQVDSYQIGQKNNDAIVSGAFWFYYRLGFRPNDDKLLVLSEEENIKRKADKKYRTPAPVLRKFANTEMVLSISDRKQVSHQAILNAMQKKVAHEFSGNFSSYFDFCFSHLKKMAKKYNLQMAQNFRGNALAMELCGIVSVFSDFSSLNKGEMKEFIAALNEKALGSDKKFFEIFSGLSRLQRDLEDYSG